MSDSSAKPVIFISYSHKDEPDKPREGEIQWLSFVRTYLQPAIKDGIFDLWVDLHLTGGVDLDPEIKRKLQTCDVFILLVSINSMSSNYIVDTEIAIIRNRQARGEEVYFYPLLLTPTPDAGLDKVKDKNLRPRDGRPFSSFSYHDRLQHMTEAANEIGKIAQQIIERKSARNAKALVISPAYVHISNLPETAYETLRGRECELKLLDDAWSNSNINIFSLIAEGGAGKSALVNEWLKGMRSENYRGAESVLGWSFYSQGSKERATSAEQFLNWAIENLDIKIEMTSASAKGDAIAEALARRKILLVLDGCEPLQHGLDKQQGELKDQGLRALLRRFASAPPIEARGLVILTSRLPIKDIARWKDNSAPVEHVDELSEEAGAALLRDNGIWGVEGQLRAASHDFGGHPLALSLLASFLKERHFGDVRQRDHIRGLLHDEESPRHDHAKRVMESYEKEWLVGKPIERAIMFLVGLFDRPAGDDCLRALRQRPAIPGLTDALVDLDWGEWQRSVSRLRDAQLLAPLDPSALGALDAHPLVREWFGERLKQANEAAWMTAHGRLYEYLRDATREGETPTLENLGPLYQAIAHGCRAGRHQEVLFDIYIDRICKKAEYYAITKLGALSSDLAAISWFFDKPYETPVATLDPRMRQWVLGGAGSYLRSLGRVPEAIPALRKGLQLVEKAEEWDRAAVSATNLSEAEQLAGELTAALRTAEKSVVYADRSGETPGMVLRRTNLANVLHAVGRRDEAESLFSDAEDRQKNDSGGYPLLYSQRGYFLLRSLVSKG